MIPEGVTVIGEKAFYKNESITGVVVPDGVTKIGAMAFSDCKNLENINFPDGLKSIGNYGFSYCKSLESVILPEGLTSLGRCSFSHCMSLENVSVPKSVTEIGYASFAYVPWAEENLDSDYQIINGILFDFDIHISDVVIPEGVTKIAADTFGGFQDLYSVQIPDTVTEIGDGAFARSPKLQSVEIPDSVTKIGSKAFYQDRGLEEIVIPDHITDIGGNAFGETVWIGEQGDFVIVNDVLLAYQGTAQEIVVPDGVKKVNDSAFVGRYVKKITIPEGVTELGANAFNGCGVESIDLPKSLETIHEDAFAGCSEELNLRGYADSAAQKFATANGIPFAPLDDVRMVYAGTAYESNQVVVRDGTKIVFPMYALKDANGWSTNYIKLRDLAYKLNGTQAQFDVGWDGTINLTPGQPYSSPNGSELRNPFEGDREYMVNTATIKINGEEVKMDAFVLTDDEGGQYTYFKLRDLGKNLGFNVGWDDSVGVYIETDKPYSDEN